MAFNRVQTTCSCGVQLKAPAFRQIPHWWYQSLVYKGSGATCIQQYIINLLAFNYSTGKHTLIWGFLSDSQCICWTLRGYMSHFVTIVASWLTLSSRVISHWFLGQSFTKWSILQLKHRFLLLYRYSSLGQCFLGLRLDYTISGSTSGLEIVIC